MQENANAACTYVLQLKFLPLLLYLASILIYWEHNRYYYLQV